MLTKEYFIIFEIVKPKLEKSNEKHYCQSLKNPTGEYLEKSDALKKGRMNSDIYAGAALWIGNKYDHAAGRFTIPKITPHFGYRFKILCCHIRSRNI